MKLVGGVDGTSGVGSRHGDLEVVEIRNEGCALVRCVCGAEYVAQVASLADGMRCPRKNRGKKDGD